MEQTENKKVAVAKKPTAASLRVKIETRKKILSELVKVNKKSFGRKVRVDQLLNLLISLLTPEHVLSLQEGSLSNADRLEMKFRDHVKKFGAVTKDEFLGLLMAQEIAKT